MRQRIAVTSEIRKRYRKAAKKKKSQILNEFVQTAGYNRSYARFVLGSLKKCGRKKKYSPRKRGYDISVFHPLKKIWIAADCICGKRLKPFIPELVRVLERDGELKLNTEKREKLYKISAATVGRILFATKKSYRLKKGIATTKPGSILKSQIPTRAFVDWKDSEKKPGYFETDLVAFCGEKAEGEYVNGLNLTDVFLGWVLLDAVMGKAQSRVFPAIDHGRKRLPYTMLGLDPDNGSEFINWHLYRYCKKGQIAFTRIRSGKKNDNCFVEQKNYTTLRRFIGYGKYDTKEQLTIIKQALKLVEAYVNFFQPSLKLIEKKRIGSKVKKKYDTAQTPYQRLIQSDILKDKENLTKLCVTNFMRQRIHSSVR